jgi:hypothetical protein
MCKKEKCPNFDKCKCNSNNVMTTSPRNLLNTQFDEGVIIDNDSIVGKLSDYNTDTPIVFNYFLLDEEK